MQQKSVQPGEVCKCIVAGSRWYNDFAHVERFLLTVIETGIGFEIVSGCCDRGIHTFTRDDGTKVYGVDGLGERFAKKYGIKVKYFPADWNTYGISAGPRRNEEMAKYADVCILFWNGNSKGSHSMKRKAQKYGLEIIEENIW
jgi:hypothetical protein